MFMRIFHSSTVCMYSSYIDINHTVKSAMGSTSQYKVGIHPALEGIQGVIIIIVKHADLSVCQLGSSAG